MPVTPRGGYELEVELTCVTCNEPITLTLPVADTNVVIPLKTGVVGLENVDGRFVRDGLNVTRTPLELVDGRRFSVTVTVRLDGDQTDIAVRLDGAPLIRWKGRITSLTLPEGFLPLSPQMPTLGCTSGTEVVFHAVKLRMLDGHADFLPRPVAVARGEHPSGLIAPIRNVEFSPDGATVLTAGSLTWRDSLSLEPLGSQPRWAKDLWVQRIQFTSDGSVVYVLHNSSPLRVVVAKTRTNKTIVPLAGNASAMDFALSPDDKRFAIARQDGTIEIWSAENFQRVATLKSHDGVVKRVIFSPMGNMLASVGDDATVRLWNTETSELINELKEETEGATTIAALNFSPDGKTLVTGQYTAGLNTGECAFWDVGSGELSAKSSDSTGIYDVGYSPDGRIVASSASDRSTALRDVKTGRRLVTLLSHTHPVISLAFSPDGKSLITGAADGAIHRWDLNDVLPVDVPESSTR